MIRPPACSVVLFVLFMVAPLHSQSSEITSSTSTSQTQSKIGNGSEWYFGIVSPYQMIDGDFDGSRYFTNDVSAAVVPTLDPGLGWGVTLGLKSRAFDRFAVALDGTFTRTKHSGQWAGVGFDSVKQNLNIDVKLYGFPRERVQPYALIGYSIPNVEVKEGGLNNNGGSTEATYLGMGLNLGVGVLYYVTERFAFHFQPMFRLSQYSDLEMNNKIGALDQELNTSEFELQMGATFRFQSRN